MVKRISGYIRDIPNGTPLLSIPVTVLDDVSNVAVASNDPVLKTSANPVNTDSVTGLFTWTTELSPGPVRIDANIGGGKHKIRSGREVMEAADYFVSDVPTFFNVFTNGIIGLIGNSFVTTSSGLALTMGTGGAIMKGFLWQTTTNRIITIPSNNTMPERWDLLVLQQYVSGPSAGKQSYTLKQGTTNQTNPAINTDPNIYELALYQTKLANGGGTVVLTDLRTYSYSLQAPNSVTYLMLSTGAQLSTAEIAKVLKAPLAGSTPTYDVLALGELSNVLTTTPATGQLLQWNGSAWAPYTLPAYATSVHTHTATQVGDGSVDNTELAYLNTVTSNVQTQINAKAPTANPTFTGTTTVATSVVTGTETVNGAMTMKGALDHDGTTVGFYNTAPVAKPTISGSKAGNAALASLLTQLAALGLITDSTS